MSIQLRKNPTDKIIELGGGANPHVHPMCMGGNDVNVDVRICHNAHGQQTVDFAVDFDKLPLPINSNEFDGAISIFALEHVSWRKARPFLKEVLRIVKPGAKVVFVTPNTDAQIKYILSHPNGWDGRDLFDSASCILFGDNDYLENSHKSFWTPIVITQLLQEAGFEHITTVPYGNIATDLATEASKPIPPVEEGGRLSTILEGKTKREPELVQEKQSEPPKPNSINHVGLSTEERTKLFDRNYFNGNGLLNAGYQPFYWDFPKHEVLFRKVMDRKPESVVELGAARGYVLKKLEDAGIDVVGFDISKHAYMTRVTSKLYDHDLCVLPWPISLNKSDAVAQGDRAGPDVKKDLCFSQNFWEYVPEELIPAMVIEMGRVCKRGLHGIAFSDKTNGFDNRVCTLRPKEWWKKALPKGHEIFDSSDLERGEFPQHTLLGDGKVKINLGCAWTQFHNGWQNLDVIDIGPFSQQNGYKYIRSDVRNGLPCMTGTVDMVLMSHVLEHFTEKDGLSILRDIRRALKPTGVIRIIVPDAELLNNIYTEGRANFDKYDEINGGCAEAKTKSGKLWSLLHEGHSNAFDMDSLCKMLNEAGFVAKPTGFRRTECGEVGQQILRETSEMSYGLSLFCEAIPLIG